MDQWSIMSLIIIRTLEHNPFNDAAYNDRGSVPLYLHVQTGEKPVELELATV